MSDDYPVDHDRDTIIAELQARLDAAARERDRLASRHWTCNKCGGSWNCDRADVPKDRGNSTPVHGCPYCERDRLAEQVRVLREECEAWRERRQIDEAAERAAKYATLTPFERWLIDASIRKHEEIRSRASPAQARVVSKADLEQWEREGMFTSAVAVAQWLGKLGFSVE